MTPNRITIEEFLRHGDPAGLGFENHVLLYDRVDKLSMLRCPCRVDAITALVCLDGELDCTVNLTACHIREPGVLVNFPENIIRITHAAGVEAYALLLSRDYVDTLQVELTQRIGSYLRRREQPFFGVAQPELQRMRSYHDLVRHQMLHPVAESGQVIGGLVQAFLYEMVALDRRAASPSQAGAAPRATQVLDRFMQLLAANHARERSVRFYADCLCLTPNYFAELIRTASGKTPSVWIDEYVVLEAKSLLRFSGMSVQQVAYRLNFPTQSAFGKYFKAKTGLSPRALPPVILDSSPQCKKCLLRRMRSLCQSPRPAARRATQWP